VSKELHVIGSGGHAKVAVATARAAGLHVVAVYDDRPERHGETLLGAPIVGACSKVPTGAAAVIAIGDNRTRQTIADSLRCQWRTLVHPRAILHPSVIVGAGTVIYAGAIVQPDTTIGLHVILNTGCTVDHDCRVEAFAHVGPGVHLCGGVRLGQGSLMGVGSCAIPGTAVGSWATVGAGAAVTKFVPDNATALGVPARVRSS